MADHGALGTELDQPSTVSNQLASEHLLPKHPIVKSESSNKLTPSAYHFFLVAFINVAPSTDDGRLDVDLDSRVVKSLSLFLPNLQGIPAQSPEEEDSAPPYEYANPQNPELNSFPFPIKLNIVIQVVGSRGDVQPFVALGTELQRHGHRVRLATHNVFDSFVHMAGLEFFPIGGDPTELMAYMVRNPGLIPSMKSLRDGDIQKKRKMMSEMLRGFWQSCIEPDPTSSAPFVADAIIANPPSFAYLHCAQALGIPVHLMFTMPWTSTRAFPHPLANIKTGKGSGTEPLTANYISYAVVEFLTWQGLGDIINVFRESIDLEPIAFSEGPRLAETLKVPFSYCWSPALVSKPADWGSHIDVCGFFFREPPNYTPSPDLDEFLRNGPPPIYIGFGSIVIDDPERMSAMILEAVGTTGTRALISRGWSKLDGPESEKIMFLGDCPHEWLFQHVKAVIHHGGAGTTACGLLNGRPTTIVPFFGDQPFWGDMVAAAGAGPKPIPQKSLTVETLVRAIEFCLTPEAAKAAQGIKAKMETESGVKTAVLSFHKNLPTHELECEILRGDPAAWVWSQRGTRIRLSKVAAEILSRHLKLDFRRLQVHESRRIVIETRRWDPITGTVSAAVGVGADLIKAATDVVARPVQAYIGQRHVEPGDLTVVQSTARPNAAIASKGAETPKGPRGKNNARGCINPTAAATVASMGTFLKHYANGLVIIPFAFTEGFRSVPLLYGEDVRDYGEIHDWKSGAIVGVKAVVYGVVDGVGGLFILPYQGGRKHGPFGVVKGVGKGVVGLSSKLFTAAMGVAVYPLQGIYKSIWAAANSGTRHSIQLAQRIEGQYLTDKGRPETIQEKVVMDLFAVLKDQSLPS
ncbi:sterol glucosyltransferase [Dactylonectria estremocensis]|uniref:Sterol glucosyltransferase n=1 Tax=Dactylonectria estremocensis TaxID=1079267 RepID=A0A9P9IRA4_9HYPO|nr:sterol glucosyltransferase [Dactylonectria estremocensis]